jgi:hypothetical protein
MYLLVLLFRLVVINSGAHNHIVVTFLRHFDFMKTDASADLLPLVLRTQKRISVVPGHLRKLTRKVSRHVVLPLEFVGVAMQAVSCQFVVHLQPRLSLCEFVLICSSDRLRKRVALVSCEAESGSWVAYDYDNHDYCVHPRSLGPSRNIGELLAAIGVALAITNLGAVRLQIPFVQQELF